MLMQSLDLKKEHKEYYTASLEPSVSTFGEIPYMTIDGMGAPASPVFLSTIQAIFPLAFKVKYLSREKGQDFVVSKLEAQWWGRDGKYFAELPVEEWCWKFLFRLPDFVEPALLEEAKKELLEKKAKEEAKKKRKGKEGKEGVEGVDVVENARYETLNEGKCVQVLHIGPYNEEPRSMMKLQAYVNDNQLSANGRFHEIYMSDPRRTPQERLQTILRLPVA